MHEVTSHTTGVAGTAISRMKRFAVPLVAMLRRGLAAMLAATLLLALPTAFASRDPGGDLRRFMHGVAAVQGDDRDTLVFFSSSALPPIDSPRGAHWTHDIYLVRWSPETGLRGAPTVFIGKPEAQEPVSAARNADGAIMLTTEDGWQTDSEVTQRYGVYDSRLRPVLPYPQTVEPGGHSGHVAAVGQHFIVAYSDGWVDRGGVDDLGSGNGVYAKVYDGSGDLLHDVDIVHERRAWWPVVTGGATRALVAWQSYVPGRRTAELEVVLLDPLSGRLSDRRAAHSRVEYYTYNVAWLPVIERFLLLGTASGHGFAQLIDEDGRVAASLSCMPATVREAGIAVKDAAGARGASLAYTPSSDGRLLQLRAEADSLVLDGVLTASRGSPASWYPLGSVGLFRSSGELDWLSLTPKGIEQVQFHPDRFSPPSREDLCR